MSKKGKTTAERIREAANRNGSTNGDLRNTRQQEESQANADTSTSEPEPAPLPAEPQWPAPLAAEAFHGLAGECVRLLEPASEADPTALLVQLLVAFGSAIGRSPHFQVENDRHHANEFVTLVGRHLEGAQGNQLGADPAIIPGRRSALARQLHQQRAQLWGGARLGCPGTLLSAARKFGRRASQCASRKLKLILVSRINGLSAWNPNLRTSSSKPNDKGTHCPSRCGKHGRQAPFAHSSRIIRCGPRMPTLA